MEELLIILIQFLLELVLEVFANLPFQWASRRRNREYPDSIAFSSLCWFLCAALLGAFSLWAFPQTLIATPALRITNLIIAPLLSGGIFYWLAQRRCDDNPILIPRNHLWQAFWFTLGFTVVRFVYATHT